MSEIDMSEAAVYDDQYGYYEDAQMYEYPENVQTLEYPGRFDGWAAFVLFFFMVFGPMSPPMAILPPIRSVDFVIVYFLFNRLSKTRHIYGGFVLSPRVKRLSMHMLILTGILFFATTLNFFSGAHGAHVKDFFGSINMVRMTFVGAIMASFTFGERQIKQFVMGLLIISFMSIALAFAQKTNPSAVSSILERFYAMSAEKAATATRGLESRVGGTYGNPNMFALLLVILASGSLAFSINIKGPLKLMSMVSFAGLAGAILITTGSRTGMLTFVLVTGFLMLLSLRGKAKLWVLLFIILMLFSVTFVKANLYNLNLNPRIIVLLERRESLDEGLSGRYGLWVDGIAKVKESIIWGKGMAKFSDKQLTDNGYIMVMLRTGITGFIVYISMFLSLFVLGLKAYWFEKRPYQKAMITFVLIALVSQMLYDVTADFFWLIEYSVLFTGLMGLLCSMSKQALDEKARQSVSYYQYYDTVEEPEMEYSTEGAEVW